MWVFTFAPDWIFHTIFFVSLIATLMGFLFGGFPLIGRYATLLKFLGSFLLMIGVFLEGALFDYKMMQDNIAKVKAQAEQFQQQAEEANDKLAKKSKEVQVKIKTKKEYITRYIDKEVKVYDNKCEIPKVFIDAHNKSAESPK